MHGNILLLRDQGDLIFKTAVEKLVAIEAIVVVKGLQADRIAQETEGCFEHSILQRVSHLDLFWSLEKDQYGTFVHFSLGFRDNPKKVRASWIYILYEADKDTWSVGYANQGGTPQSRLCKDLADMAFSLSKPGERVVSEFEALKSVRALVAGFAIHLAKGEKSPDEEVDDV